MTVNLENTWKDLTGNISKSISDCWWTQLRKNYNESGRNCHNYLYLEEKFNEFEMVRKQIKQPDAFALALFFQNFDYDPKDSDCYLKNIKNFNDFSTDAGLNEGECQQVRHLLESSAIHSTEEHKTAGAFGDEDLHYFLDIDMAILGSAPERYAQYTSDMHTEYSFLDSSSYKNLRKKVLQSFLLIPNIFATKEFREKFEAQARDNIKRELESLTNS